VVGERPHVVDRQRRIDLVDDALEFGRDEQLGADRSRRSAKPGPPSRGIPITVK
jgi:hypothetical protein